MADQKLTQRTTLLTSEGTDIVHVVKAGVSYKQTVSELVDDKILGLASGYQGFLAIADTPTSDGYYYASESGTYINAGSLVVTLANTLTIINVTGTQTVFEKVEIPIGELGYELVPDITTFNGLVGSATGGKWLIINSIELTSNKTIPAGVTLVFNGGDIKGAFTLTGTNTKIEANIDAIFGTDLTISGAWDLTKVYPEWFENLAATDDSAMLQAGLDFVCNASDYSKGYVLELSTTKIYETKQPLRVYGDNWKINGNGAIIRKTTNDLPSPVLPLFQTATGGYYDVNLNAVIVATAKVRWSEISDLNIEGNDTEKTVTGIVLNGYHNTIKKVYTRWVHTGFLVSNMFLSNWENCEARNCVDGWRYDATRLTVGGVAKADETTGTSTVFNTCHVVGQDNLGFYIKDLSYSSMLGCAVDGGLTAYYLVGCFGFFGQLAFERPLSNSTGLLIAYCDGATFQIDSYDDAANTSPAIEVVACNVHIKGRLRVDNDIAVYARVDANVNLEGLVYDPITGSEIDVTKFTTDTTSFIRYLPSTTYGRLQRTVHNFHNGVMRLSMQDSDYMNIYSLASRVIYYGNNKLRVVYDVTDFATTYNNEIKIPLADIALVIPDFDNGTWKCTPLQFQITELNNMAVGDFVIIRNGVIDDSGQLPSYWQSGTLIKTAVTSIAIVSSELVITLDGTGGSRQRVSCEVYQAK
jgi:hypothetical protein